MLDTEGGEESGKGQRECEWCLMRAEGGLDVLRGRLEASVEMAARVEGAVSSSRSILARLRSGQREDRDSQGSLRLERKGEAGEGGREPGSGVGEEERLRLDSHQVHSSTSQLALLSP